MIWQILSLWETIYQTIQEEGGREFEGASGGGEAGPGRTASLRAFMHTYIYCLPMNSQSISSYHSAYNYIFTMITANQEVTLTYSLLR